MDSALRCTLLPNFPALHRAGAARRHMCVFLGSTLKECVT